MARGEYRAVNSSRFEVCRSMRWWEWLGLAVLCLAPVLGGFLGARLFNSGKYKNDEFRKPDWAPPAKMFSPVWVILYLMMGFASFLLLKIGGGFNAETLPPFVLYVCQLLLNWSWTPLLFGFGLFNAAEMVLATIIGLVFACIVTFVPVSKVAACLLVPYFSWLCFAALLNYDIVCFNSCYFQSNFTCA